MILSGEDIRQEAERREQTCPKGMKNSYYYGFREGAKWAQHAINEAIRTINNLDDIDE